MELINYRTLDMGHGSSRKSSLHVAGSIEELRGGIFYELRMRTKTVFVFWKVVFKKISSNFFCICLLLEKLVNKKHFLVKEKFSLISRKMFFFYFGRKTLSGSCEKFRNIILFADYIKFGPQTFDCYIYFVLNICFSIPSLRI